MKVCVDAGHGVEVAGKCAPDKSYYEHDFNLFVAKRMQYHLERHGLEVVMTRNDEHDISLGNRCKIANDNKCGLFLSVHTNAAGDDGWYDASGWSAHVIKFGGEAEKLARNIHDISIASLNCVDRGVNENNYYVLRNTDMPAVLIEHGFHTDIKEVQKLKDKNYRELCAISNVKGILKYMSIEYKEENILSWQDSAKEWAIKNNISDGSRPKEYATREEIWAMLQRTVKNND